MNRNRIHKYSDVPFTVEGKFTINATADDWTINYPSGRKIYPTGTNQTQVTQVKPGADFFDLIVDSESKGAISSWTFTNLTSDHNISTIGIPTPGQIHVFLNATPVYWQLPLTVTFTNQSLGSPTSFFWQFGDGSTATTESAAHLPHPRVYTVTLRATNAQTGGICQWNNLITVTNGPVPQPNPTPIPGEIMMDFSATPTHRSSPLPVQFTDRSTGNPTS